MTAMPKACVIGHPVAHSRSPMIHNYWLEQLGLSGHYERADVTEAQFPEFLRRLRENGYVGANVTVPHKETAFRHVARRDAAADAIGAINTLWYEQDELVGGNTDAHGFIKHLAMTVPGWERDARKAVCWGRAGRPAR